MAAAPMLDQAALDMPCAQWDDPDRPPLPAGDPVAWDPLVAGTWLAGTKWPGWGSVSETRVRG